MGCSEGGAPLAVGVEGAMSGVQEAREAREVRDEAEGSRGRESDTSVTGVLRKPKTQQLSTRRSSCSQIGSSHSQRVKPPQTPAPLFSHSQGAATPLGATADGTCQVPQLHHLFSTINRVEKRPFRASAFKRPAKRPTVSRRGTPRRVGVDREQWRKGVKYARCTMQQVSAGSSSSIREKSEAHCPEMKKVLSTVHAGGGGRGVSPKLALLRRIRTRGGAANSLEGSMGAGAARESAGSAV